MTVLLLLHHFSMCRYFLVMGFPFTLLGSVYEELLGEQALAGKPLTGNCAALLCGAGK